MTEYLKLVRIVQGVVWAYVVLNANHLSIVHEHVFEIDVTVLAQSSL